MPFNFIHREKTENIYLAYDHSKVIVINKMMHYKNVTAMVSSLDRNTDLFDSIAGV